MGLDANSFCPICLATKALHARAGHACAGSALQHMKYESARSGSSRSPLLKRFVYSLLITG